MKKKLLILSSLVILNASSINLNITNDTLETNLKVDIPQNFSIRGDALYNDKKNNYYSVGFQANGVINPNYSNTKFKLFVDYVYTKKNSALPIGMGIYDNSLFSNSQYSLFANAEIEYAPTVLSFRDAKRFLSSRVEFGISPIQNAKLFVGYRIISFNHNYGSNIYGGVGFKF